MYYFFIALLLVSCSNAGSPKQTADKPSSMNNSIHQFKVPSLDGGSIDFSAFKGKKILVVNTASECGYTPQYAELQDLYENHRSKLEIVGFPANEFGAQESGSNEDIKAFCQKNYGVTFPMAQKIVVKGPGMHPVYQWLTSKEKNGVMDSEVKWNFNKYLLDENGILLKKFDSDTNPLSESILNML